MNYTYIYQRVVESALRQEFGNRYYNPKQKDYVELFAKDAFPTVKGYLKLYYADLVSLVAI